NVISCHAPPSRMRSATRFSYLDAMRSNASRNEPRLLMPIRADSRRGVALGMTELESSAMLMLLSLMRQRDFRNERLPGDRKERHTGEAPSKVTYSYLACFTAFGSRGRINRRAPT